MNNCGVTGPYKHNQLEVDIKPDIKSDIKSDMNNCKRRGLLCIDKSLRFIIAIFEILQALIILGIVFLGAVYVGKVCLYLYCSANCGSISHKDIQKCNCYNVSKHNFWYDYNGSFGEFFIAIIVILVLTLVANAVSVCYYKCRLFN